MEFTNQVVLITGASNGIGRQLAVDLSTRGAIVAGCGRSIPRLKEVLVEVRRASPRSAMIGCDVGDAEQVRGMMAKVLADYGKIDILINNAGITKDNLLMRISEEDFDTVINVNLKSVFNMTKAVQKTMLKNRKGSIINMSSVVGVKGNAGQTNYAASKAGVIGFTKSVALELGSRNIRCNAIAPGFIETEMTAKLNDDVVQGWRDGIPLKRGGTTEDVANACLFLASDMSAYITGQVMNVDGGMLT